MAVEFLSNANTRQSHVKLRDEIEIPPLENGDNLTLAEFRRRYEAMPDNIKAELIEGVVYLASPVRMKNHGKPHAHIMTWLGVYSANTDGTEFADNVTLVINRGNDPQPDAVLRITELYGGNSFVSYNGYLEGSPELAIEIAASTASYDSNQKKNVYRRNQIQEYIVWRESDQEIDWFSLENDEYVQLEPDADGIVESRAFVDLRLNVPALLNGNLKTVLTELQKGLDSDAHRSFLRKLAAENKPAV